MKDKSPIVDYIDSRVDLLSAKFREEAKQLRALDTFLQTFKRETAQYTKALAKSFDALRPFLAPPNTTVGQYVLQCERMAREVVEYAKSVESVSCVLGAFVEKYEKVNGNLLGKLGKIVGGVANHRAKVKELKNRYFREAKVVINCGKGSSYNTKLAIAKDYEIKYKKSNTLLNESVDINKQEYEKLLQMWYTNEDFKNKQVAGLLGKLCDHTKTLLDFCAAHNEVTAQLTSNADASLDLQQYLPISGQSKPRLFKKLPLQNPPNCDIFITKDIAFTEDVFDTILDGKAIKKSDEDEVVRFMRTEEGLKAVCREFAYIVRRVKVADADTFASMARFALVALEEIRAGAFSGKRTSSVVRAGAMVCCVGTSGNRYLREAVKDQSLWNSKELWNSIISYRIAKAAKQKAKKRRLTIYAEDNLDANNLKINKVEKVKRAEESKDDVRENSALAFTELKAVVPELAYYCVNPKASRELIVDTCRKYKLEEELVHQLLLKYETSRPVHRAAATKEEIAERCAQKAKFRYSSSILILRLSLQYIPDCKALLHIMLLSKQHHCLLKPKICGTVLARTGARHSVWHSILYSRPYAELYLTITEDEIKDFCTSNKKVDNVIRMDVERSFGDCFKEVKESVTRILRCYAILNPKASYCQGMHCVANLLFFLYRDEPVAFSMLCKMIDDFGISPLLKNDVPLFHPYFHKLNRLVGIYLPELQRHLSEESFDAALFASPWFLTAFTYVVHWPALAEVPPLLLAFLHGFLTQGVKSLFKSSLFLLELHQEEYLKLEYGGIFQSLSALPKSRIFYDLSIVEKYRKTVGKYNVSNKLLEKLQIEYEEICRSSADYIVCSAIHEEKHYLYEDSRLISVKLN